MPSTVHLPVLVEVNEINQELTAAGTREARWVPTLTRSSPWSKHHHLPSTDVLSTLKKQNQHQTVTRFSTKLLVQTPTCSQDAWSIVLGSSLRVARPRASFFLCTLNMWSSFFSSSLRDWQYRTWGRHLKRVQKEATYRVFEQGIKHWWRTRESIDGVGPIQMHKMCFESVERD